MHQVTSEPKEIERQDKYSLNENMFNDALVVISNLIARATTKWTLEETKLFLCSVSQIKTRDKENWVTMPKRILQKNWILIQQIDLKCERCLKE